MMQQGTGNVLFEELKKSFERGQSISNPKHYIPWLCHFTKIVLTNPFFDEFKRERQGEAKQALRPVDEAKRQVWVELDRAEDLLVTHLLDFFRIRIQELGLGQEWGEPNYEKIISRSFLLRKLCRTLSNHRFGDYTNILNELFVSSTKKLVFDSSVLNYEAQICIFERERKTQVWYALQQLMLLLKKYNYNARSAYLREIKMAGNEQEESIFLSDCFDLDQFDGENLIRETNPNIFEVERYRIYQEMVWNAVDKYFTGSIDSPFTYKYEIKDDARVGYLSRGNIQHEMEGVSASVLCFVLSNENYVHKDAVVDFLAETEEAPKKAHVENAIKTIRSIVAREFGVSKQYIVSKNGFISVDYPTKLHNNS